MARKTQNVNLKLVEQHDEETKRQEQEKGWKLTPGEVAGRARDIRKHLEKLAERLCPTIAGLFDRVH